MQPHTAGTHDVKPANSRPNHSMAVSAVHLCASRRAGRAVVVSDTRPCRYVNASFTVHLIVSIAIDWHRSAHQLLSSLVGRHQPVRPRDRDQLQPTTSPPPAADGGAPVCRHQLARPAEAPDCTYLAADVAKQRQDAAAVAAPAPGLPVCSLQPCKHVRNHRPVRQLANTVTKVGALTI